MSRLTLTIKIILVFAITFPVLLFVSLSNVLFSLSLKSLELNSVVIFDRVICDMCHSLIGQLYSCNAQAPDLLSDHGVCPHRTVCPDCALPWHPFTSSVVVDRLEQYK